jgi:hypothetical protein
LFLPALGFAEPAAAFSMRSYTAGRDLLTVCADDRDGCYMYVYGVLDNIMLNDDANKTCTFNPEGAAGDKAVAAVLSYLRTHSDRLDWSAAALVQNAIRSKFPCGKKKPDSDSTDEPADPTP